MKAREATVFGNPPEDMLPFHPGWTSDLPEGRHRAIAGPSERPVPLDDSISPRYGRARLKRPLAASLAIRAACRARNSVRMNVIAG